MVQQNKDTPELIAALQYYKINYMHQLEVKELGVAKRVITIKYENFIKQPEKEIDRILTFVSLEKDKSIKKFMSNNEIFNRNKKEDYYFSKEMDEKVMHIAINGCEKE